MAEKSPLDRELRHHNKQRTHRTHTHCQSCGESELRALQRTTLTLCAECRLALQGKPIVERHHPAGAANDAFAAPLLANLHAVLSDFQQDWPAETLRNPHHDFRRQLAAWLRFFHDVFTHLATVAGAWARRYEREDAYLEERLGPAWWLTLDEAAT